MNSKTPRVSWRRWAWILALPLWSCAWWPLAQTDTQTMVAGCGGGVTGGGGEVVVNRGGRIVRRVWTAVGGPVKETMLRTDPEVARRLFDQLEAIGFTRIQLVEPSNVTCSLSLETPSGSHAVVWPPGSERAPDTVRKIFAEIMSLDPALEGPEITVIDRQPPPKPDLKITGKQPPPKPDPKITGRQPPPKPNLKVDPTRPPPSPPLEINLAD